MDKWTEDEQAQVIKAVRQRAAADPSFRALALEDAAAALAKVTTKALPTGVTFRFVDNSGPVKTFPLPDPMPETDELSDTDLERVAGGNWTTTIGWSR